ncbi:MAG: YqgE/AlgH family protein [Acidimicrobiales bacterium]
MLGGRLLVATPQLDDPNFVRTVVLVLEHGEPGAIGVVLNRPMHVEVGEILGPWAALSGAAPPGVVFRGGPVAPDAVIGLARPQRSDADWRAVAGDGGVVDLAVAPDDQPVPLSMARLFSGYAGWGAEQIEGEIEDGSWWVLEALVTDLFCEEPAELWHDVLRRQSATLAMFAAYPADLAVN